MRLSLLYNPLVMIDRMAVEINRHQRKKRLKGTPAARLSIGYLDSLELLELIRDEHFRPKVVYDVGANIGTWTLLAKSIFEEANVHAFEPLAVHTKAFAKNTNHLSGIYLHTCCLGNDDKAATINVSSFSDSSSLLEATPLEFEQYGIRKVNEERVEIRKISSLLTEERLPAADIIKLDVQGYELEVLKGAGDQLREVSYIIAEVSFKAYYQGQPLFLDLANYLAGFGLQVHAFGHSTPRGQELGQIDILFKNLTKPAH